MASDRHTLHVHVNRYVRASVRSDGSIGRGGKAFTGQICQQRKPSVFRGTCGQVKSGPVQSSNQHLRFAFHLAESKVYIFCLNCAVFAGLAGAANGSIAAFFFIRVARNGQFILLFLGLVLQVLKRFVNFSGNIRSLGKRLKQRLY